MFFTADDDFHDGPKTWNLPDCAAALWSRAGSWSARNAQDGFVPAEMLARFCSDPVQAIGELLSRGLWRRVKGGYQFTDWEKIGETTEQVASREADAQRKREQATERQRRSRANRKGAEAPVTPMSRVTSCDTPIDRSDQSSRGVGQSDARPREDPALAGPIADALAVKANRPVSIAEAEIVIGRIRGRAARSGTKIRNELVYMLRTLDNEPDLYAELLPVEQPPLWPPAPDEPPPADAHRYRNNPRTNACVDCDLPKAHVKHRKAS